MPVFEAKIVLPKSVEELFEFFSRPANLPRLAPADAAMELVEGPEMLEQGSEMTWKGKRLGMPHQLTLEVTEFDPCRSIVFSQRSGTLAKLVHTQIFRGTENGTEIHDRIEFEPPSGVLGMFVNAKFIEQDLGTSFAHREQQLRQIFAGA